MSDVLTVIIACASLIVAFFSLLVAYVVYFNNSIADVIVYSQPDPNRPSVINLIIHNIGQGTARDISFTSSRGIPKQAYGLSKLYEPLKTYDSGAFVNGLPLLYPNEKLIFSWGQYGGLKDALNGSPLEIKITFYSPLPLQIFKRKFINTIILDPTNYEGVDISESVFEGEIKKSLREISSSLKKMSS
jgi:hypothetical protein